MSPRIQTSEPAYRAPTSQWQRERARGRLQPMEVYPVAPYELWGMLAIFLVAVPTVVGLWWAL
jgi:hypothetical protein